MAGLTNGLPIFVSKYDSLDTDDNLTLFDLIANMKELDARFTILVVNQADSGLYMSKRNGRNQVTFFDPAVHKLKESNE